MLRGSSTHCILVRRIYELTSSRRNRTSTMTLYRPFAAQMPHSKCIPFPVPLSIETVISLKHGIIKEVAGCGRMAQRSLPPSGQGEQRSTKGQFKVDLVHIIISTLPRSFDPRPDRSDAQCASPSLPEGAAGHKLIWRGACLAGGGGKGKDKE